MSDRPGHERMLSRLTSVTRIGQTALYINMSIPCTFTIDWISILQKMRSIVAFLATLSLCHGRPQLSSDGARPSFMMSGEQYIVGGTDADPGEFPWQLSVQQQRGASWSHIFGATLLSSNYGLSAAHIVDGALSSSLRVVAGLHRQTDLTGTQTVDLTSYTMHPEYGVGVANYANDICIFNFATPVTIGGNIQPAILPADNSNDYAGYTCVITGWGSADVLQKASIEAISTAECQALVAGVIGANVWDNNICVYDTAQIVGNCGGDSGGPLNCPDDVTRVAGVASWFVSSGGGCSQSYPSIFTRTSAYLQWIAANTP